MNRRRKSLRVHAQRDDDSRKIWVSAQVSLAAILGFLLLFFFGNGALALARHYLVMATVHQYEDRELEIVSYRGAPGGSSEDPLRIKGILYPERIEIHTDDHAVSLMRFNESNSMVQMAPDEKQVVGQRVNVRYYVGKPEDLRWWQPPQVHNWLVASDQAVQRTWAWTVVSLLAVLSCFFYAYRKNRQFKELDR